MNKAALVVYHLGFIILMLYAAQHKAVTSFVYITLIFLAFEILILRKSFRQKRPIALLSMFYLVAAIGVAYYRINIAPGVESDIQRSLIEHGIIAPFVAYLLFNYFTLPPFEEWPRRKSIIVTFAAYNFIGLLNESIQSIILRGTIMPAWETDTFVDLAVNFVASAILLLPWMYVKNPFAEAEPENQ